jgi:putative PIN family toxin of toxin-antitoxin system
MNVPLAVFDCMVYLQAAARPDGPARACLGLVQSGRVAVAMSPAVRAEVEDVLGRPKVRQKFKSLTSEAIAVFLSDLDRLTTTTEVARSITVLPRDPKDEPYLNLALTVGAKYLVTWDNDLLSLMGENPDGTEFRDRFPALVILTPVAFLRELTPTNPVRPTEKDVGEPPAG